jgi:Winged helix DNA-binding domain
MKAEGPSYSPSATTDQVAAFRLGRHHLLDRAATNRVGRVLADMSGAQAQLLSAGQLALWARVRGLTPQRLDNMLWAQKTLVRAWCMRRTLYLLPSRDAAIFARGSSRRAEKEVRWMLNHGASRDALERALVALLGILDQPRTRREIAQLLSEKLRTPVESRSGGVGWGSEANVPWLRFGGVRIPVGYALHLAGARGVVCLGPVRGVEATYVRAEAWTESFRDFSIHDAEVQLLRRYLSSFAPATPQDFAVWTGTTLTDAQEVWGRAASELTRVSLAGKGSWILRRDLPALLSSSLDQLSVRLLPHFDSFLLGHRDHGNVVVRAHHKRVYRAQGWVSPVLLVNGTIAGVWSHAMKGNTLKVRVEPFGRIAREVTALAREEVRALGAFLGTSRSEVVFA